MFEPPLFMRGSGPFRSLPSGKFLYVVAVPFMLRRVCAGGSCVAASPISTDTTDRP